MSSNNNKCDGLLQTLSVITLIICMIFLMFGCLFLFAMCFSLYTCWIPILYLIWFIYDFNITEKGGRKRSEFLRSLKLFNYVRDYFPASLIKTADLDPNKNYLITIHPHGVLSMGSFLNFATESTSFSEKFPNIKPHLLTLSQTARFPFWREFSVSLGMLSCSEKSIKCILENETEPVKEKGQAACLLIGGLSEQYLSAQNEYNMFIKTRKGFVRIALETGTSIVPAISFGENDTYKTKPLDSFIIRTLEWIFKNLCCSARYRSPIFHGRWFSIVPYRKKLTMVIGKPIEVEKIQKPTDEQINDLRELYIKELTRLFEDHKSNCSDEANSKFVVY